MTRARRPLPRPGTAAAAGDILGATLGGGVPCHLGVQTGGEAVCYGGDTPGPAGGLDVGVGKEARGMTPGVWSVPLDGWEGPLPTRGQWEEAG